MAAGIIQGSVFRSRTALKVPLNCHHRGLIYCICQVSQASRSLLNYCSEYRPALPLAEISQKEAGNTDSPG